MNALVQEIFEMTKTYFGLMDKDIPDDFLMLLVQSVIDNFKNLRNYPEYYTDAMIDEDVIRYFTIRKSNVAMEIIPEMYGRIGAEGLSMLTDAGTSRFWTKSVLLHDVTPICEVI